MKMALLEQAVQMKKTPNTFSASTSSNEIDIFGISLS